jgi:hypothetical protein
MGTPFKMNGPSLYSSPAKFALSDKEKENKKKRVEKEIAETKALIDDNSNKTSLSFTKTNK